MRYTYADRCKEFTTDTGSGDLTLMGAAFGCSDFATAGFPDDTDFPYVIEANNGQWETGIGQIHLGVLKRNTPQNSSDGPGVPVTLSAGNKYIFAAPIKETEHTRELFLDDIDGANRILSTSTPNATPKALRSFLNNTGTHFDTFDLGDDETLAFDAIILATIESSGVSRGWHIAGVAKHDGVVTILGTPLITDIGTEAGTEAMDVTIGIATDLVTLLVTGIAGTVQWTGRARLTRAGFGV